MNNIYDVILNFQKNYYEVYEWKNTDEITNIRKIPFFKVDDKTFYALKNNIVKINEQTLNYLKYNCLIYGNEEIPNLTCLVTNTKSSIGILFDNEGNLIKRSSMIFEEEDEVVEEARRIKETKFNFIKNEKNINQNKSRIEIEKKQELLEFIKKTNDINILKYIYYDYYLEESKNKEEIKNKLINEIEITNNNNLIKLHNTIKIFIDNPKNKNTTSI